MSSFVKLPNLKYAKLTLASNTTAASLPGFGMSLEGGQLSIISAPKSTEEKLDGVLAPKTIFQIDFGVVSPARYELLVSPHPELAGAGLVSLPSVIPPYTSAPLVLTMQTVKQLDLNTLPWLISIHAID